MGIGSANEMRRYSVTLALIGRAHVQKDLWIQWNPSIKATQDDGLSKEVACHEG